MTSDTQFGKYYIGCKNDNGTISYYSWDTFGWRFATIEQAKERFITFTRMTISVAQDTLREIREANGGQYKDLRLFLIPKEDAVLWGIEGVA